MAVLQLAKNIYPRDNPEDGPRAAAEGREAIRTALNADLLSAYAEQCRDHELDVQGETTTRYWWRWQLREEIEFRMQK